MAGYIPYILKCTDCFGVFLHPYLPLLLRYACRLPIGALNDRMARLGAATAGIGLFAMAIDAAQTLWAVCALCFGQVGDCSSSLRQVRSSIWMMFVTWGGMGLVPWP